MLPNPEFFCCSQFYQRENVARMKKVDKEEAFFWWFMPKITTNEQQKWLAILVVFIYIKKRRKFEWQGEKNVAGCKKKTKK